MILDYSYGSYKPVPGYVGLGNAWTFNSAVAGGVLTGLWSNVLTVHSRQPIITCESNQPRMLAKSRQKRDEVEG
jgi:hypothetical protein